MDDEELEEMDRNARAYGWEIGQGAKIDHMVDASEENPFLDVNWRDVLDGDGAGGRSRRKPRSSPGCDGILLNAEESTDGQVHALDVEGSRLLVP